MPSATNIPMALTEKKEVRRVGEIKNKLNLNKHMIGT